MSRLLVSVPFYFGFVYANKKKKGGSSESSVTSEWKKKKDEAETDANEMLDCTLIPDNNGRF